MAIVQMQATLHSDIRKVWDVVTDVEHYIWRSDLSKTKVLSEKQFVEYTKDEYATTFTITIQEPYQRWEFDMENSNMYGHWIGVFTQKGEYTEIVFIEEVTPKKWFMKPLLKGYLKKQQALFLSDLQKALL